MTGRLRLSTCEMFVTAERKIMTKHEAISNLIIVIRISSILWSLDIYHS